MTRVLLTGAGGFVGHHTLEHLLVNTDWEIVCIDSFRHRGKTDRIREVLDGQRLRTTCSCPPADCRHRRLYAEHPPGGWASRVHVLTHDLRVPITEQLDYLIGEIDYVVSMASESHVDRSCVEPRPFIENNVALVLTLLEWLRERNQPRGGHYTRRYRLIEKFLHVSTDEVYGPAVGTHNHYEGEPHRPSNPYAASKACQEDIVFSYWRTFGLPVAVSNTMNIIGERQDPEKFVPKVIRAVDRGEVVPIHAGVIPSEGTLAPGSRFYLHARNQADALLFILRELPFPLYGGGPVEKTMGRWNVVGELEIDNLNMAHLIADAVGKELRYELTDFHSSRPGHDLRYALDGKKLAELGWTPPVPLAASLAKTVRWTLDHPHWLLD
jgi:dTDP-glucose 4,6-dehydratase